MFKIIRHAIKKFLMHVQKFDEVEIFPHDRTNELKPHKTWIVIVTWDDFLVDILGYR